MACGVNRTQTMAFKSGWKQFSNLFTLEQSRKPPISFKAPFIFTLLPFHFFEHFNNLLYTGCCTYFSLASLYIRLLVFLMYLFASKQREANSWYCSLFSPPEFTRSSCGTTVLQGFWEKKKKKKKFVFFNLTFKQKHFLWHQHVMLVEPGLKW